MALTPNEIKAEIMRRGDNIKKLAVQWGHSREDLSRIIHDQPGRSYPKLRAELAKYLGLTEEEVFGHSVAEKKAA